MTRRAALLVVSALLAVGCTACQRPGAAQQPSGTPAATAPAVTAPAATGSAASDLDDIETTLAGIESDVDGP